MDEDFDPVVDAFGEQLLEFVDEIAMNDPYRLNDKFPFRSFECTYCQHSKIDHTHAPFCQYVRAREILGLSDET